MSTVENEIPPRPAAALAMPCPRHIAECAIWFAVPGVMVAFSTLLYPGFQPLKEALLMTVAAVLFVMALAGGWLWRLPRMWLALLALYCAAILFAWAASYQRSMGTNASLAMIAGPLFCCAAVAVIEKRIVIVEIIAATGALEAAITLAQWLAGWDPHQWFYRAREVVGFIFSIHIYRPIGTIGIPDVLGLVMATSFPAALTLMADRNRSRLSHALWLGLAMLDLAAIGGSACRASLVAALVGGSVVAASRWMHLRRRTILTMLAIAGLAGTAFFAARVANRRNLLNLDMATTSRTFAWRVGTAHWPGGALLGSGPGTFRFYYMRLEGEWLREHNFEGMGYAGANSDVQNDFLQARLETGWLGLAALVAVLAWWTRTTLAIAQGGDPEQRAVAIAALGGVLALVFVATIETSFQHAPSRMLIWLWMALPLSYRRTSREAPARFAMTRAALALALLVLFTWDAGRIVLSRYWTERGYRREFAGDLGGAVADDRRAVETDLSNTEARFHLGRSQWKAGDSAGAIRTLDDAALWDSHPRVYEMRIRVLYRSGRRAEALHRAAEGARMFPWAPELQAWRSVLAAELLTERRPAETRP